MAKRKVKEPEPVELQPEPKGTVLARAKGVVKRNPNATWRTFQLAFYGFMAWALTSAPGYIDKYMDNQKKQTERQAGWQIERREQFQYLKLQNDTIIAQNKLMSKHFKIKNP